MTPRRLLAVLAALLLAATLAGPLAAEEPVDDAYPTEWASISFNSPESNSGAAQVSHALGMDLYNGRIRLLDAETVEFQILLWNLPATGGTPEVVRYTWDFDVQDAEGAWREAVLDGKWMNYSRGACDPTAGCNPPEGMPRDPGAQPFLFRANQQQTCLGAAPGPVELPEVGEVVAEDQCVGMPFTGYDDLDLIQADFAPDGTDDSDGKATISIRVPLETFNLIEGVEFGHCSQLRARAGLSGGMIEAQASAFVSVAGGAVGNALPRDNVLPRTGAAGIYTVPPPAGFDTCAEYVASLDETA